MAEGLGLLAELEAGAQRHVTTVGKGKLVWRSWGKGPDLILLHGGHGSWRHWVRNIPALSARFRVIVPDLPGMGDSDPVGDGENIEPVADALAAGIDQLAAGSSYILGGFSFGCLVSGYVLARHHGRVSRLIMLGSGGLGPFTPVQQSLRRWQEEPDALSRRAIHRHNLAVLMIRHEDRIDPLAIEIQTFNAEHTRINHRGAAVKSNLASCLRDYPVPITGVWGAEDALMCNHLEERRALFATLPDAKALFIPQAGHWIQYEAADEVNQIILDAATSRQLDRVG